MEIDVPVAIDRAHVDAMHAGREAVQQRAGVGRIRRPRAVVDAPRVHQAASRGVTPAIFAREHQPDFAARRRLARIQLRIEHRLRRVHVGVGVLARETERCGGPQHAGAILQHVVDGAVGHAFDGVHVHPGSVAVRVQAGAGRGPDGAVAGAHQRSHRHHAGAHDAPRVVLELDDAVAIAEPVVSGRDLDAAERARAWIAFGLAGTRGMCRHAGASRRPSARGGR